MNSRSPTVPPHLRQDRPASRQACRDGLDTYLYVCTLLSLPSLPVEMKPVSVAPMTSDLNQALRDHFGFEEFLPGQREVIEHLVAGRSAAAVFPTGGGKSLCYQLPSLLLPGLTLVVSPLIALMKDQIDALTQRGIPAVRIDSSLYGGEYQRAVERLRRGELRILYVAPERFNNERFRELLQQVSISLFAVDEAHCISEWGHAFRPDYLKLARFADQCDAERRFALTATATDEVLTDICREFRVDEGCAVRTGFYRSNLHLRATSVTESERDETLVTRLRSRSRGATIVYVTLQRTAVDVAERLTAAGIESRPYHAGLPAETRAAVQDWFLASEQAVIVATIAFGMGIDKPNIRYVYHYNLAKSLENYSQEIGRAGRDGGTSICETLVCPEDLQTLEDFVLNDTPDAATVRNLVEHIFGLGSQFHVNLHELSKRFNIGRLVIRTLLTYLELAGLLEGGTPQFGEYKFQPRVPSAKILDHFEGERRTFVAGLLRQATKARTWFALDIDAAVVRLQTDRSRIVRAMDYLAEQQWLDLRTARVQLRYQRQQVPEDLARLADDLFDRCLRRQEHDLQRLQQMDSLMHLDGCQVNALAAHFGEIREEDCGHCQWCEAQSMDAHDTTEPQRNG